MRTKPYGLICPITRACEILEPRWTVPILTALWTGETRFNDIRRGVGSISPALLSKRLKELEDLGLVERVEDPATGSVDYIRTEAAIALEPALNAMAEWAQRYIDAEIALSTVTVSNLMWSLRNLVLVDELPKRRVVMQFHFSDPVDYDTYWVLTNPGGPVEICTSIPGYDIDLFVETNAMSLLGIIQARTTIEREIDLGELFLSGDPVLSRTMDRWLKFSDYAGLDGIRELPRRGRKFVYGCAPERVPNKAAGTGQGVHPAQGQAATSSGVRS